MYQAASPTMTCYRLEQQYKIILTPHEITLLLQIITLLLHNSPEEVLHGRKKYWYSIYILNFAHICCCFSSHCGVPVFKLIHVLSLQASSDPTSDIGIVSFSFSIHFANRPGIHDGCPTSLTCTYLPHR